MTIPYESPYDLQERLKRERGAQDAENARRAQAEAERLAHQSRPPAPVPLRSKLASECTTPAELAAWHAEQKRLDDEQAAAVAEDRRKQSARTAFVESGGADAEFEARYPALREEMILAETRRRLDAQNAPAGSYDQARGVVRW